MVHICYVRTCREKFTKGGRLTFHSFPKDAHLRRKWCEIIGREDDTPTNFSKLCSKHFREEDFERHFGLIKLKKGVVPTIFKQKGDALPPEMKPPQQRTSLPTTQKSMIIELNSMKINFGNSNNTNTGEVQINKDDNEEAAVDTKSKACQSLTLHFNIVKNIEKSDDSKEVQCINEHSSRKDIHFEDNEGITERPILIGRKSYVGDYKLSDMFSPTEAAEFYQLATKELKEKRRKVKYLRRRVKHLECRNKRQKFILRFYQENSVLSENAFQRLKNLEKQVDFGSEPSPVLNKRTRLQKSTETSSDRVVDSISTSSSLPSVNPADVPIPGPSNRSETKSSMVKQEEHLAMTCDVYPANSQLRDTLLAETSVVSNSDSSLFEPPFLIKEELVSSEEEE